MRVASKGPQVRGLPVELTSFVGRRHEITEVKRLLAGSRLVTLIGVGGVGKTRLALRVAADVRRAFRDGVCLVELAALDGPELLTEAMCDALGITDLTNRPVLEILTEHVRDKQLLLVLDNCEHLLHDCAVVADALERSAPGLRILATSRQALGVAGEQAMVVPPLPLPDADVPLEQSDAVRLFAERAGSVMPGFTVTNGNRDAVTRICQALDGMPLAIELAAARLRVVSVQQLVSRLEDRFGLLCGGSRVVLPRQRTLRALIDWSYVLCAEQEQTLWARLSVFSGSLDLEAAEHVCSGDGIDREEIVDLVIGLVDKSILLREEQDSRVRYRLLETIRQYGRDRLRESGQEERLRRRHRDWYQELVLHAQRDWFGPDQVAWYARLRTEHDNIRTALDYCLAVPGQVESGLVLAAALRFYWIAANSPHEGRNWLERLLAADTRAAPERAAALCLQARLAVLQSDFAVAAALLEESRELAARFDEPAMRGGVSYVAGLSALLRQEFAEALSSLTDALELGRAADDQMGVANALIYVATVRSLLGSREQAIEAFEEVLAICEPRQENWFRSYALWAYGVEVWKEGDTQRAVELERQALRLKEPFDDRLGVALCVEALSWIYCADGDGERATLLLSALKEMWRSFGGPLFGYLVPAHQACEKTARDLLGARKFDTVWRKGTELTPDEVVEYAMREEPPQGEPSRRQSPLTRREMEIARLVAEGMSNKTIAATLVIAQRTAEGHVEHILSKLGFNSRVQIAAWVSDQERSADDRGSSGDTP